MKSMRSRLGFGLSVSWCPESELVSENGFSRGPTPSNFSASDEPIKMDSRRASVSESQVAVS